MAKGDGAHCCTIPKDGAESEGQLRPIDILPYVYRVWVAVRKRRVKEWVLNLHGGGVRAPEDLVWEVAARAGTAKATGRFHAAAYLTAASGMKELGMMLLSRMPWKLDVTLS